jgi:hypothetical protein
MSYKLQASSYNAVEVVSVSHAVPALGGKARAQRFKTLNPVPRLVA